ncbi:MAG TPA: AAA family ATPase, partial [Pirellulaceae bacterium]|nr:AAA family ATPase [Pirellulaceae bacterium]
NGAHFVPREPATLQAGGLHESDVEALLLKALLLRGDLAGRDMAEQLKLPMRLVEPLLRRFKLEHLVGYRGAAPLNDYLYHLTEQGRDRAQRLAATNTYCGAAPVTLSDYVASVAAQSPQRQRPGVAELRRALGDLLISPQMVDRLGPALQNGRGLFLYGAPGNGKTSIAERLTRAFGPHIWIPRALSIDGQIVRVFDPLLHHEAPWSHDRSGDDTEAIDRRWVRIQRPTIVVGGELTLDSLELARNPASKTLEAPLQLKSNCGTLVIDDFGRQRVSPSELLNRWIVPLERRVDFLTLPSGGKIQVPFDQLVVFSTNLRPRDLVDDAFLRRIPYKIEVQGPNEDEFCALFARLAPEFGLEYREQAVRQLIDRHYRASGRALRCCHPRDLLQQVLGHCQFQRLAPELTNEYLDIAVRNYFAVMDE